MCTCTNKTTGNVNQKALQAIFNTLRKSGKLKEVGGQFYLPVDSQTIRNAANQFVENQGFVTTLQIKEALRKQGFYVTQAEISEEMSDMVEDGDVQFTNVNSSGKTHRLFYGEGTPEHLAVMAFAVSN